MVFNNIDAQDPAKVMCCTGIHVDRMKRSFDGMQDFWFAVQIDEDNVYQSASPLLLYLYVLTVLMLMLFSWQYVMQALCGRIAGHAFKLK